MPLTGITEHKIGRHWAGWGDACREAGFEPGAWNVAYDDRFLMDKLIEETRKLGHVPTLAEMRIERRSQDPSFPAANTFERLDPTNVRIAKTLNYCRERAVDEDVAAILEATHTPPGNSVDDPGDAVAEASAYGFVYLAEGHRNEHKIGNTNLVDRRLPEVGATYPVELTLIHEIRTDDPVGVEAYWHNRFAGKRMRGEWFTLAADVRAFKRWRRIL